MRVGRDTQEWVEPIRPGDRRSLAASGEGAEGNWVSRSIRRFLILAVAASLVGALVVPAAGAEGPSAAAAKKGGKCKKKKGAKRSGGKAKRCKRSAAVTQPGLPGKPLSPNTPTVPTPPAQTLVSVVTLASNPVLGGTPDSGEVTISQPAPAGGQVVTLQSEDQSRVSVPATVNVAAGQTTAGFAIATTSGPTDFFTIEASIGSSSAEVVLKVVQEPSVTNVALDYDCFPENQTDFGVNRVTTDVPVPADTTVTLGDDSSQMTTPASVVVPEDTSGAIFGVNTLLATPLVTVTATLGSSSAHDTASVRSDSTASALVDLTLNPVSVAPGAGSTGTVVLDCEALATTPSITLSSDNPDVTFADGTTVTVPEGDLSAGFQINTAPDASGEAVISATLGGHTEQATLLLDQTGT